jgi:hypothetical protein
MWDFKLGSWIPPCTWKLVTSCNNLKEPMNNHYNDTKLPHVRSVDMCWLHFVKTIVLARSKTRCLNMLVQHHIVPYFTFWEINLNREDSWIFSEDLFHVKSWPRSVFLEAEIDGLYLACSLRMFLQYLRKHLICFRIFVLESRDSAGCLARFVHQAHSAIRLYKGRLKT